MGFSHAHRELRGVSHHQPERGLHVSASTTPTQGGTTDAAQTQAPASTGAAQGTDPKPYVAPATQADLDRIIESRLARERAKYEGFDELKAKAAKLDELEQANLTELQKATARAEKAEAEAEKARLMMLRHEVAAANNLPAVLAARLQGTTREEMETDAKALAGLLPAANTTQTPQGLRIEPGAGRVNPTRTSTATTRLPGNQNALQEDLPEGGTHVHLGDVSCKSLGVKAMERCGNRRQRVERLVSAWNQGIRGDADSEGEADDALISASTEPKKRPRTQLTEKEVDAMRTARAHGVGVNPLARQFGVHRGTVWAKTR